MAIEGGNLLLRPPDIPPLTGSNARAKRVAARTTTSYGTSPSPGSVEVSRRMALVTAPPRLRARAKELLSGLGGR